jgi:hypothetical protein
VAIARVIREQVQGCSSVAFDEHALARMGERGVSEDEVLEVLQSPDQDRVADTTEPIPLPKGAEGAACGRGI